MPLSETRPSTPPSTKTQPCPTNHPPQIHILPEHALTNHLSTPQPKPPSTEKSSERPPPNDNAHVRQAQTPVGQTDAKRGGTQALPWRAWVGERARTTAPARHDRTLQNQESHRNVLGRLLRGEGGRSGMGKQGCVLLSSLLLLPTRLGGGKHEWKVGRGSRFRAWLQMQA